MTITERSISRVSFAVRLIDEFLARPSLLGETRVFITGRDQTAIPRPGGYHVFMDLPGTSVTLRIENKHYFPKEVAISIPALDARNPVTPQTMKPNCLYPFPAATTLVRGVILDPALHPVQGAQVSVVGAAAVANESEADGRFVLFWGPLDEDHISIVNHRRLLKIGNSTTIDLHVSHPSFQLADVTIGMVVEAELKLLTTPIVINP